jgi:hypothetical protein
MPAAGPFEAHFHKTADVAEDLFKNGFQTEAFLMTTVAIDALAAIWRQDFGVSDEGGPLNFAAFVREFVADPAAELICIVFSAEDMLTHGLARLHAIAQDLLEGRAASRGPKPAGFEFRESPHAHRDVTWNDLVKEVPLLAHEKGLEKLARHYTRSALAYRLYRCGPAHGFARGSRTSGFSDPVGDDEISYFPSYVAGGVVKPISLKIGIRAFTQWLRTAATNYAGVCSATGKRPADGFDASATSLAKLRGKWKGV